MDTTSEVKCQAGKRGRSGTETAMPISSIGAGGLAADQDLVSAVEGSDPVPGISVSRTVGRAGVDSNVANRQLARW